MKILFCCSSLEAGLDGVGDYTCLLAHEFTRLGHACGLMALNDSYVTAPLESEIEAGEGKIPCLRIPSATPWSRRTASARDFRHRLSPDWISVQIVPYGLNPRGIVDELTPVLLDLTPGCSLHLMFHELWTGGTGLSGLRHRLAGALQRRSLQRLIAALRPLLVTTSNPVFIAMLHSIGTTAELLPLFGNVPLAPLPFPPVLPEELAVAGLPADGPDRSDWWMAIFFGTIHPEWEPEPFLGLLRRTARRAGKRVMLVQAGRAGTTGDATWEKLRRQYRSDFVLIRLGEQPVDLLSRLLQTADFGIAASPWQLIGKSGTVAAMLDHGLPVIVTRDDFRPRLALGNHPAPDPLLFRCDNALEAQLIAGLTKRAPRQRAGEVAAQLARELCRRSRPPL
jgi:glycosyltransferase involved in cell wall biosynthesis